MTLVNTLEDSLQTRFFFTPAGGCTDMLGRPGLRGFRFPFCPALPQVLTLPQSSMVLAVVLWNVASDAELNLSQALPAQKQSFTCIPELLVSKISRQASFRAAGQLTLQALPFQ